jgi:hypothetical protein
LLGREALCEHSLPNSPHVQFTLASICRSRAAFAHAPDEIEDLGASRLVASPVSAVVIQAGFAHFDKTQRFVDIICDDFICKA